MIFEMPNCHLKAIVPQTRVLSWRRKKKRIMLKMNGLPAYRQKSKAFVRKTLLERVPGELLWPQAMEELFERDYNTIREEIEEYRRSK